MIRYMITTTATATTDDNDWCQLKNRITRILSLLLQCQSTVPNNLHAAFVHRSIRPFIRSSLISSSRPVDACIPSTFSIYLQFSYIYLYQQTRLPMYIWRICSIYKYIYECILCACLSVHMLVDSGISYNRDARSRIHRCRKYEWTGNGNPSAVHAIPSLPPSSSRTTSTQPPLHHPPIHHSPIHHASTTHH